MSQVKEMNWNNRYEVKATVQHAVEDILWSLENEYDDINEDNYFDYAHEQIDGHEYVIYNYQAKKIAEAFDVDVFGESEITGERYSSYNVIAYEIIEEMVMEQLYDKFN